MLLHTICLYAKLLKTSDRSKEFWVGVLQKNFTNRLQTFPELSQESAEVGNAGVSKIMLTHCGIDWQKL